ncbi:hypothetical protein B0O80DRAFT_455112 [Mortierella sp. GBAus27b]|nr:hypothetical protein B0O80DRAFT_455112 [Mortierella sp. GBAus27b]
MEKIVPFDIPILSREICQYLSSEDLSRCTLVSKTWLAWFSPALWRDISFRRGSPDLEVLAKQQEHVHTVRELAMVTAGTIRQRLTFPNLQRLEFSRGWNNSGLHRTELRVLQTLEGIQTLRHLRISLALHHHDVHQQWIRTLQALTHLKKLELLCHQFVGGMAIFEFLQQCHRYEYLELEFGGFNHNIDREDRDECNALKTAIEQMQDMRLREVAFITSIDIYTETVLIPLLERCPLLETLNLERLNHSASLRLIASILSDGSLPNLRHYRAGTICGDSSQDAHVKFLGSLRPGLESFGVNGDPGTATIEALVQHHAHSLTDLNLNTTPVSMSTFSSLMAGLPNLRSMKAHIGTEGMLDISIDRAVDIEWTCVDLRSLDMHLDTPHKSYGYRSRKKARRVIDGRCWRGSKAQRCLDYVFSQITKLRDLETLHLESTQHDLFVMKSGYLGQLAGLKRLRAFDLDETMPKDFGELQSGSCTSSHVALELKDIANWSTKLA